MVLALQKSGFEIRIYPHDHFPPSVHVYCGSHFIVIYLCGRIGSEPGVLWVRESHGLNLLEEQHALELVTIYHSQLLAKWEEVNRSYDGQD